MNLKRYVLVVVLLFLVTSCQQDLYKFTEDFSIPEVSQEPPVIQYVIDTDNYENVIEESNIRKVADYTKLPYQSISINDFNKNEIVKPSIRVICVFDTRALNDKTVKKLVSFVAKGGTLFLSKTIKDKRFAFLIGLNPEASFVINKTANGYYFNKPVFPGRENFSLENKKAVHLGLDVENFSEKVEILASANSNHEYPLIVKNEIGKGKVVLFNSTERFTKNLRGLMFANILNGLEGIPYPIVNVATIFLDDFPSPIYDIKKEPIQTELNQSVATYVTDTWWSDMKKLAKEEQIKYTAYLTFDYNSFVIPPFTFREWDKNVFTKNNIKQQKSSWLGRDILADGHELGFHGYNHVSLTKEDWPEHEFMTTALNTAKKKWNTLGFGELPVSYVPPSNHIDSLGIAKLHEAMPNLRYMQSTYLGYLQDGGDREFDPDAYNNSFFGYPRISSGFAIDPVVDFSIESLYLYTGIWTHFVHPDDVYQIPDGSNAATSGHYEYRNKNSLPWYSKGSKLGLLDTFKAQIKDFKKHHPKTEFVSAKKGSKLTMDWRYSYFTHNRLDGNYIVENEVNLSKNHKQFWLTYVSEENQNIIEKDLKSQEIIFEKTPFLSGYLYTISTSNPKLSLPDLNFNGGNALIKNDDAISNVLFDYKIYKGSQDILVPLVEKIETLLAEEKLKEATDLLIAHIKTNKSALSKKLWKDLATYLVWQKRGSDIWPVLEDFYSEHQTKYNAELANTLSKISDYPNIGERQKWLSRQISWGTDNIDILDQYIAYFYSEDYKDTVDIVLRKLLVLNPNLENQKRYISHLINYNPKEAFKALNKIEVCDNSYLDLATTITWYYADNFHFDKAVEWEKCSTGIQEETVNNWLSKSKYLEDYKKSDFPFYISVLLANNRNKKALKNLQNIKPCSPDLNSQASNIAKAYASFKLYREALWWGECASDLDVTSKLYWLYELKDYDKLEKFYNSYINENPKDYSAKLYMGVLYNYMGELKKSVEITANLPVTLDNAILRKKLNTEIKTLNAEQQKEFVDNYGDVLFSQLRKDIHKNIRHEEGNSISINSYAINDKLKPTTISNIISYNFFDEKRNIHSVSATQSIMYPINTTRRNRENSRHNLYGIEYRFKNQNFKPTRFFGKARIEKDQYNTLFFQLGTGVNFSKNKQFSSLQLDLFPVRSGPGHSLKIYQGEFNSYNEFILTKKMKQILALQSNYYSDGEIEGLVLGRTELAVLKNRKVTFSPYVEGAVSLGSIDRRNGYPYWMAKKRVFGGGGFVLNVGNDTSDFKMNLDASIFAENNESGANSNRRSNNNFERYTGNASYRVKDFTTIKFSFEVFTIENFFSNVFQLGVVYDFK